MKRCLVLLLSLLSLLLSGAPVLAGDTVRIQLKWHHQFQFAGYYAAIEKGFFADEGLEVELLEHDPLRNTFLNVYEGEVEYGVGDSVILLYQKTGLGLHIVAPIFQESPTVLITLADSGIETPQDLIGRRIRLFDNDTKGFAIMAFLADQGVIDRGFIRQPFSHDLTVLERGETDVIHGYVGNEPFLLRQRGVDVHLFQPRYYGIDLYGDMLFTSAREAELNPQRVEAMRRAVLRGWEYALDHKEEIAQLILDKYSQRKSFEALMYEAHVIETVTDRFTIPLGTLDPGRVRHIKDLYVRHGLMDQQVFIETQNFFHRQDNQTGIRLSDEEIAFLGDHPVIRVGIDLEGYPLEFVDEQGRHGGISADYLDRLQKILGVRFEVATDQPWTSAIKLVRDRELDMLAMAAQTPERSRYALFTQPYLRSPMVIVTSNQVEYIGDPSQLEGKEVTVVRGYASEEWFNTHAPDVILRPVDSTLTGLELVSTGQAFAMVDSLATVSSLIKQMGLSNLKISGQLPIGFDLAMAARSDWPLLRSILQKALDAIPQEEKNAIYDKWIRLEYETRLEASRFVPYFLVLLAILFLVSFDALRYRRLHQRLHFANQKLQQAEERLTIQNRELEQLSSTDKLTGVCNRLKLDATLGELLTRLQHQGGSACIIMFDLDHFKRVNDGHGHRVGDAVLHEFAQLACRSIRSTDIFGRWGGEEFMLICPQTSSEEAAHIAERIRTAFAQGDLPGGHQTVSAGVAQWQEGESVEEWIDRCDQSLYQAKLLGRNRVVSR